MGDRLVTIDMGRKVRGLLHGLFPWGSWVPSNWDEAYLRTKWQLIHPTVWPQYTKVTDRQDNGPVPYGSEPLGLLVTVAQRKKYRQAILGRIGHRKQPIDKVAKIFKKY